MLARLVTIPFFLYSALLGKPVFIQCSAPDFPNTAARLQEPIRPSQVSASASLDIYIQGTDSAKVEEAAAITLFTAARQLYRQGIMKEGHLQWNDVAPNRYELQVIAPGFEPAVQPIEVSGSGEVRINIPLHLQAGQPRGSKAYPPESSDGEVNYVFGLYAARLGDWQQAQSYWTKVLQLIPDHVPALVSMSEALLNENKVLQAMEYLVRAEKIDPSYWRTQALEAEIALRAGSAGEAVQHAERAIELGKDDAASVSPLLARALVARANEVLGNYVKDHPEDAEARKQWEILNTPAGGPAVAAAKPASPSADSRWLPPDVDESVPPAESASSCNLSGVLEKAGQKIQEFVANVDRFTATEYLVHETLNRLGKATETEKRKYDYVVSIAETRPGFLSLQEYESNCSIPADAPGGMTTKGLPALILIFHPYYSGTFSMKCEGLATLEGKRVWQIYFRQREDKPNKIRSYRVGTNTDSYPIALKGRAWIVADSYQILGLQTDLIKAVPDIRLTAEHTSVRYGPVHFSSRGVDMWLPETAEVYSELRGKRVHRRLSFSNYLLFSVDDKQQIAAPKTNP
jgi:tetratricopeptide (TPR) repeat protein